MTVSNGSIVFVNYLKLKGLALLPALFVCFTLFAQDTKTGNWTMYFGQIRFSDKWSGHYESQFRDYGVFDEPEQILLRAGINYHAGSRFMLTAGYGRITNYHDDEIFLEKPLVSENRLWQQFLLKDKLGRFYFEHRYRVEQRWLSSYNNTSYKNRIRYLIRINVPLNKKELEQKALFLSFYDEVFLNFSASPYDRNRLYGAIGYQLTPSLNLQLGYLAQNVVNTKHYLQAAVFYNLDLRKD